MKYCFYREDLEEIDTFLREFIKDLNALDECDDSWDAVNEAKSRLSEKYNENSEISLEHVIEEAFNSKVSVLESKNAEWCKRYLEVSPETMNHQELGKWIDETEPLPGYINEETKNRYTQIKTKIDDALKAKRLAYIYFLFQQLPPDEQKTCFSHLKSIM